MSPSRHPAILAAANGRTCVRCGTEDGTTVSAHYQGARSLTYGKGKAIKPHDAMTADLCHRCHTSADSSQLAANAQDHSAEFLRLIIATHLTRYAEGVLECCEHTRGHMDSMCSRARLLLVMSEEHLHGTALWFAEAFDGGHLRVAKAGGAKVTNFVMRGTA